MTIATRIASIVAAAALAGAASASSIVSDFENGLDGWTSTDHTLSIAAENGDSFLSAFDRTGGYGVIAAPEKFRGDLSAFNGGALSFEGKQVSGRANAARFGEVTIFGGGLALTRDLFAGAPTNSFQKVSGALTASFWGVDEPTWTNVLANVSALTIVTESFIGVGEETTGIDNVALTAAPVPLPAAAWMLIAGLGALGGLGMRRGA